MPTILTINFWLFVCCVTSLNAQSTGLDAPGRVNEPVDSLPEKRSVWRFGGGTGLMVPIGLPSTIFGQIGVNVQLGATNEYYWRKRVSVLTGVEYRLQSVVADARFTPVTQTDGTGKRIIARPAPDSIKYASLRSQMISIPIMIRYYFARNAARRVFIDVGASINFPVAVAYRYRTRGMNRRNNLTSFVQQPIILIELAAGANGKVFGERFTKANNLLGALLFGGFVSLDSSIRDEPGRPIATAGFLTKFVF